MSQYSPSFGRAPLPPPSVISSPIIEVEDSISVCDNVVTSVDHQERSIVEEVLETIESDQDENEARRSEPCKALPSILVPSTADETTTHPYRSFKGVCPRCTILLGVLLAVALLLAIGLFLAWAIISDGFDTLDGLPKVCNSRECVDTAFRFSNSVDNAVNACDNFYQFSCGKFHRQDIEKQRNFPDIQVDSTRQALYSLLSAPDFNDTTRSARLSRTLFTSCMDFTQRAKAGYSPLVSLLRDFPCCPIFNECNFNSESYSWERHSGMLGWYANKFNLIVFGTDVHPQSRSQLILQFRPPDLSPLITPVRKDLVKLANPGPTEIEPLLIVELRQNLTNDQLLRHIEPDERHRQSTLGDVAQLMLDIDKLTNEVKENITYMTLAEFKAITPQISWQDLFGAELSLILKLVDTAMVSVMNLKYFEQLGLLVMRYPPQALANFLVVVSTKHLEQFIYDERQQRSWLQCVMNQEDFEPTQKLFILNNRLQGKDKLLLFLDDLKKNFIESHRSHPLQYLSDINRISFLAEYPRRLIREDLVWETFATVPIDTDDYFATVTRLLRQQNMYRLSQIGKHLDSDDTTMYDVLRPTIQYNSHLSVLVLPIAFLQPPVAAPGGSWPMYAVFGSLGVTVNHALAKIFWRQADQTQQKQCLDSVFRGFLNSSLKNTPSIEDELSRTIELADAVRTTSLGYLKWQQNHSIHGEQALPSFATLDSFQSMMLVFGTMFCSTNGAQPGSPYEAMMNTVASSVRLYSVNFHCENSSSLYSGKSCL